MSRDRKLPEQEQDRDQKRPLESIFENDELSLSEVLAIERAHIGEQLLDFTFSFADVPIAPSGGACDLHQGVRMEGTHHRLATSAPLVAVKLPGLVPGRDRPTLARADSQDVNANAGFLEFLS